MLSAQNRSGPRGTSGARPGAVSPATRLPISANRDTTTQSRCKQTPIIKGPGCHDRDLNYESRQVILAFRFCASMNSEDARGLFQ
jgi:hypothetical protein